ncbi:MAG: hypothetical protein OXF88_12200 [Rhodobacteraceae bacterium]|nr:hypothetical protein [Paracoccaceae bacterium]
MMTRISIDGQKFLINGVPLHQGRTYKGKSVEGLLFNCRMVQAIFDDENPETVENWAYPDTGEWDPERNVNEFIAAMPDYLAHGCTAVTVNLQGGMPITKTERDQPWVNSAIDPDGELKPVHMDRLQRLLEAADELGMIVIVGFYYFGQDKFMVSEEAVRRGTRNASRWLLDTGLENILVEINNESDVPVYVHDILKPPRVHELIELSRKEERDGRRLIVSTSFTGGSFHGSIAKGIPTEAALEVSDYALVHTNRHDTQGTRQVVQGVRQMAAYKARPMPVVINEDSISVENLFAAVEEYAPWGYYDQGDNNYRDGFQSPPVNWRINTPEKKRFFDGVAEITGCGR